MYEYRARLLKVVDGDTCDVDLDLGFNVILSNQRVRLFGIDTPESRTRDDEEKKFGLLSKQYLKDHLAESFKIRTHKDDARGKFGRILGEPIVYIPEFDREMSICEAMIHKGLAVEYFGQSKDDIEEQHLKNRERLYESGVVTRG